MSELFHAKLVTSMSIWPSRVKRIVAARGEVEEPVTRTKFGEKAFRAWAPQVINGMLRAGRGKKQGGQVA